MPMLKSSYLKKNTRTISLLTFLIIFITLPFILNHPQKHKTVTTRPDVLAATAYPIYGLPATNFDQLNPTWTAHTWYNDVNEYNPINTSPIYEGTHSIYWTAKSPWDELDLIAGAPVDISQLSYLTFYAQTTQVGQSYNITLLNTAGKPVGTRLTFSQGGVAPNPTYWTVYNFPLASFNAGSTTIGGIGIADQSGGAQPAVYIDDINLSGVQAPQTTPTPQINAPASNATAFPTPEPFYYPEISPWVFIVPGIIIFLAIFL